MPNQLSFVIPCESQWIEGIYQLECSDRLTGYDPSTGIDGISNQQGKELGDRTLYLRDILNAEHINGHHAFKNADFLDETQIPESALKLHYGTSYLYDKINALTTGITQAEEELTNLTDINLSYTSVITILMPYSAEYFKVGTSYELFTDSVKLRSYGYTNIIREIAGDDSLDVASTKGIKPGKSYFLMNSDGSCLEEVVVQSVLSDNRIRFTTDLVYTRSSGYLSTTTIIPEEGKALVTSDFVYLSDTIDTLVDAESGKLFIHRDNVDVSRNIYYCIDGSNTWVAANYIGRENFYDGTIDDIYELPAKKLKLRVEYSCSTEPYNLYYFVVKAINEYITIEEIRRPKITNASVSGNKLIVNGNTYASLWGIDQNSAEVQVYNSINYPEIQATGNIIGKYSDVTVTLSDTLMNTRPLYVQLRYSDTEGTYSRWSNSFVVE